MALTGLVQGIIINIFLLLGFVALFSMVRDWPAARVRSIPAWANGLLFGATAIVAMLVPTSLGPGVIFDCRSGVIGTAALMGGPLCALASIPLPLIYRLHLGGSGLIPGLLEIVMPAILGSICHRVCRIGSRGLSVRLAVLSSLVVGFCSNGLVVGFITVFIPAIGILSSTFIFIIIGPISMALFSVFLLLSRQNSENAAIHTSILQTAMDGYLLVDMQGRLREINETYCRMSHYSKPELLTKHISDIEASMNERQLADFIRNLAAKGGERFESSHRRKDGSAFDIEASIRYLPVAGGLFVSFIRDITERKKAQEALQESERKYKLLIETTNTGFVILDNEGKVLDANQEYLRMTGRSRLEDILGRAVTDWTAPRDLERNAVAVRECLVNGLIRNLEIDYLSAQGQVIPVEIHATVLSGGESSQILSICRDISERSLAMKEKERLNLQLIQAQKMESVGRLAGGVAHDFNNMLSVILGHVEFALRREGLEQSLYADLKEIQEAAQRSADLTRNLLAFARRQTVAPRVLDLNDTIAGILNMLRRLIGENINLTWTRGNDLWPIEIDPSQVDQILTNLCVNARDAIADIGRITINTENRICDEKQFADRPDFVAGEYVLLAVRDSGRGMNKETLRHIFEPFFTTKRVGEGTGLGLATVYGIVRQNNGFINVDSEPGQGTTIEIYLPRYVGKVAEVAAEAALESRLRGQETILLVEDEPSILKITARMLEHQGCTVLAAPTPGEAMRLAREHAGEIHILMTDVVMPEINGRDLAKNLMSLYPQLKCLFMSGWGTDVIAHQGVLEPGSRFIQKPFSMEELAAALQKIRQGT